MPMRYGVQSGLEREAKTMPERYKSGLSHECSVNGFRTYPPTLLPFSTLRHVS